MKLSALKKEILLVLLSESVGGSRLVSLNVDMIINEIEEIRSSSFKSPHVKPLSSVCVQRSLERLARDGLVNRDMARDDYGNTIMSQKPSLRTYYLNSNGTRKAREIEAEIRNYVYKWWKFIK